MAFAGDEFHQVHLMLDAVRVRLMSVVDGSAVSMKSTWMVRSETSTNMAEHVKRLNLPNISPNSEPHVILHELGRFQFDPRLLERLDAVFTPHQHTCVTSHFPPSSS